MAKTFAELSEKEKSNFEAQLKALGIEPGSVAPHVVADGSLQLHPNEALTNVATQTVQVKNVAHLKKLWGVSDEAFKEPGKDKHIQYPAPLEDQRVKLLSTGRKEVTEAALSAQEHQAVSSAIEAYVNGDSKKVPAHLVELANTLSFPMAVRVMAAQNLTITGAFPVSQALVCGTITIEQGGYISVVGDATINAQVITVV